MQCVQLCHCLNCAWKKEHENPGITELLRPTLKIPNWNPHLRISRSPSVDTRVGEFASRSLESQSKECQTDDVDTEEELGTPTGRWLSYAPTNGPRTIYIFGPKALEPNQFVRNRVVASIHCEITDEVISVNELPVVVDFIEQTWMILCPKCRQNHSSALLEPQRPPTTPKVRQIDFPLNVDLGELIEGQHVILRGIENVEGSDSQIHNDFVPGFTMKRSPSWGLGAVTDDIGTVYDHSGAGGWGPDLDRVVRWGNESLGNTVPSDATRLSISFHCDNKWEPAEPWVERLVLNLKGGGIAQTHWSDGHTR